MENSTFCTRTLCALGLAAAVMTGCKTEDSGTGDQADSGAGGIEGGATPGGEVVGGTTGGGLAGGESAGGAPVGGAPVGGAPVGGAPVGGAPVGGAPVGGAPVGGAPVGGAPVGGAPVGGEPVGGAPVGGEPVGGGVVPSCEGVTDFATVAVLNGETGRWTYTGDTTDGLSSGDPACGNSDGAPDNTFAFTAPEAGSWVFTTSPITPDFVTFDTILSVLSNCASVDSTLACDDDGGEGPASLTSIALAAGQTVYLTVDGFGSGSGAYELSAGLATLLADGEACGLDPFSVCAPTSVCYEDFASEMPAVCTPVVTLNTGDACEFGNPLAVCPADDICYSDFNAEVPEPPVCTTVVVLNAGDACDPFNRVAVCADSDVCYNDVCTTPVRLNTGDACEPFSPAAFCPVGDECFEGTCTTAVTLNLGDACVPGSPAVCPAGTDCIGDVCAEVVAECPMEYGVPVDLNASPTMEPNAWSVVGDTTGGLDGTACDLGQADGLAVVYAFVAPVEGQYAFETTNTMLDTVVYVRENCGSTIGELACDDDGGVRPASLATAFLSADQTVYVFVDTYSADESGPYTLNVTYLAP